jgi:GNAT superfamily N-acetyltransferase
MSLRLATLEDIGAIARIHRASFNAALPHLADLHTPQEDLDFFGSRVLPTSQVWVSLSDQTVTGFAAVKGDWLDHLYVDPNAQDRGFGSQLLLASTADMAFVQLWTFQINARARAFYERHGFKPTEFTNGANNDEREPDVRYVRIGSEHRIPGRPRSA